MQWREAKSLLKLLDQVNAASPNRSKANDGQIGDTAHASRKSDHNPNDDGVVCAIDITHDPKHAVDSYKLAEKLRLNKDRRIKYVISNHRIFSSTEDPWRWRPYRGSNPHDCHVHVSVKDDRCDLVTEWDIGSQRPQPRALEVIVYPLLRKGMEDDNVRKLQELLGVSVTGKFDNTTEAAVRSFQRAHNLASDGIVGNYTWRELKTPKKQTNIVATVFGGRGDPQSSAYDDHPISEDELSVALPFRFIKPRPLVRVTNRANGQSAVCKISDIGPWNGDDPYWSTLDKRPQSETGFDMRGRPTNKAGIDLSPAVANAIGIKGKGAVDWEFEPAKGEA